jgi:formate-dependent nitrite reductase membrane component NrfD
VVVYFVECNASLLVGSEIIGVVMVSLYLIFLFWFVVLIVRDCKNEQEKNRRSKTYRKR